MQTEFEAKFTRIDKDLLKRKLKSLGAKRIYGEKLMRRELYDFPDLRLHYKQNAWVRIRNEGNKVTLTYKSFTGKRSIRGQKEINLEVDSYVSMVAFLKRLGLKRKSLQEQKRERWVYKNIEISIDTWPGLTPFVELEGKSERSVRDIAKVLDFKWRDTVFGGVAQVYLKELGIDPERTNSLPEITFANPPNH